MRDQDNVKSENSFNGFIEAISRDENEAAESDLKKRLILSLIFLAVQISTFGIGEAGQGAKTLVQVIALMLIIAVNHGCFVDAYRSIYRRRPEKNLLAAIGTILAIAILAFVTAGVIMTTMAVCRYIESYIKLKLHSHLTDLMDLEPSDAGVDEGDIIMVLPGDILPADGIVLSGGSSLDEEIITGERVPARKKDGDVVLAGTRNLTSELSIKVTRTGDQRIISQLIAHINSAIDTRSPKSERYERIARRFIIAVVAVAFVASALWILAGESPFDAAITGIAILLIANPYAFSVAIPMNVLAAVVRGAEHGIFIRSAEILEETREINTIVINKRGVITEGEPEISDIVPIDDSFDLRLAGILEGAAEHPYGKLIAREAQEEYGDLPKAEILDYIKGRGILCRFEGTDYVVGNAAFMESRNVRVDDAVAGNLYRQGKSLTFFAKGKKILGVVAVRDVPRPTSLKAITQMENLGLDVVMLTSDSRQTAEAVRNELGIDHVFADILPSEKDNIVRRIREEKKKIVAMVGDGNQDRAAIEASDLGIAIGTGREIEISPADIVLVSDDLLDVVRVMKLSRFSNRNLRQSVAFAYVYNFVAMSCAAGLYAFFSGSVMMPVASAVCMCASQILVALNSLRVKRMRV